MAGFDFDSLGETTRKIFLAGVGAVATGAEKSQSLINDLIAKGELTVEQGKAVNEELKHTYETSKSKVEEDALKVRLASMSAEERAQWVARATQIAQDLDSEPVEVEVEEGSNDTSTK